MEMVGMVLDTEQGRTGIAEDEVAMKALRWLAEEATKRGISATEDANLKKITDFLGTRPS